MADAARIKVTEESDLRTPKDKSCLLRTLGKYLDLCAVDRSQTVLVLGGEQEDLDILTACGFESIALSNLGPAGLALDAESIDLKDDSYTTVFAHAVLHHCRSPHKALGEMLRVAQRTVIFVEPNDSLALRLLVRLGFSFPYELAAVVAHDYVHGGMRDGPIPNYIYRWTGREVEKCAASYQPELRCKVHAHPYWDFYVNEYELLSRKETRVAALAQAIGARNFIKILHLAQAALNVLLPLRAQGNKFFCAIEKKELVPWVEFRDGSMALKRLGDGVTSAKTGIP